MIEFYPQIRFVHILAISLSGSLFALRGIGVLAGARWPQAALVRYLSYTIDTVLLTAALMLVTILPSAMFANHWLTVKLVLVVAYVALGVFALRRGRSRGTRAACFAAALLVFIAIIGIARMHHPLGWLLPWA
ncbi:SirB2 family protein [Luteimonas sp. 50]|uniref:SirB2 family protein n=1 Tax=Cognatiluteimonas sedimenti TaxID=2927791 RepID=A0ABT0A145_9GAMM|nr:SirB2 family protein [Lysobacter sedimenti]MCJ0824696.1 SirB2 family protein [Lysobacter sedimenti]